MELRVSDQKPYAVAIEKILQMPIIGSFIRHRFLKFGIVGLSGTVVNLAVLYINQEILLKGIYPVERRLRLSLFGAIFLATINNYLWNRMWTWGDRKEKVRFGFFIQMGQYFLACGLAIGLQYLFTVLFSKIIHYLIANLIAIIFAAIFTYILNDLWTFAVKSIEFK